MKRRGFFTKLLLGVAAAPSIVKADRIPDPELEVLVDDMVEASQAMQDAALTPSTDLAFSDDGRTMYCVDFANNIVHESELRVPFDISSAFFTGSKPFV